VAVTDAPGPDKKQNNCSSIASKQATRSPRPGGVFFAQELARGWTRVNSWTVRFAHKFFGPARPDSLQDIWHVIAAIPRGQVSTYGEVARAAGLPGRARMTAYALRVAPDELALPWHRVLGAGGRIVFPSGSKQFREQARRLRAEGVKVTRGKVPAAVIQTFNNL
jgi:methylated-DNA-protein-cysteine methyltransferase-like protein